MKTVYLLALCLTFQPAWAIQARGMIITLTAEERDQCEKHGGCVVMPVRAFEYATQRAFIDGKHAGERACRGTL